MKIIITDKIQCEPQNDTLFIYWNNEKNITINNSTKEIFLPLYLDENSKEIKLIYLDYIHNISYNKLFNRSLIEKFSFNNDFSFWWLNLVSEKSPFKSRNILDALKVICILNIVKNYPRSNIFIDLKSNQLKKDLTLNFKNNNYNYSCKIQYFDFSNSKILYFLKALRYSTLYFYRRLGFSLQTRKKFEINDKSIFIFTYFTHFSSSTLEMNGNKFKQIPWGDLPKSLIENGYKINWIHLFLFTKEIPNISKAKSILNYFNKENNNNHQILDSYLSLNLFIKAWLVYFKIIYRSFNSSKYFLSNIENFNNITLYNCLSTDFLESIYGSYGIQNSIKYLLFEKFFKKEKIEGDILYLYENQSWENLLLFFTDKNKLNRTIAYQHSTVPFWHLYYFNSIKTITSNSNRKFLIPDIIALNSTLYYEIFIQQGYNSKNLYEVEALRYLGSSQLKVKKIYSPNNKTKILLLGEYSKSGMIKFDEILTRVFNKINIKLFDVYFKPHPAFYFDLNIDAKLLNDNLNDILHNFDLVICTNSTSACIDAIINNVKVLIYFDCNDLNLSPLLSDKTKNYFFNNEFQLLEILDSLDYNIQLFSNPFNLNIEMPKWKKLLNLN
jgi:surface carbohydrate biosynthesis protein (TIGR04326 family)